MDAHALATSDAPEVLDFIGVIHGPELSALAEAQGTWSWKVKIAPTCEEPLDILGIETSIIALRKQELRAIGEELRRAACAVW